jgi:signal transduction histidine kinase
VAWQYAFGTVLRESQFGLAVVSEEGRLSALSIAFALVLFSNALAWIAGRLVITRVRYVGTDLDQLVSEEQRAKLALEVAEQNERFEIARDINELIIQKISAVISQAEGGLYAAKADPSSALRSLERIGQSSRAAHTELRRLYDMLNKSHEVSAAPPGLAELDSLVVLYRELGYNASLKNEGAPFKINEGAQLAIYRVIFDALENVKEHCLVGTDVSIDFSWVADGMQVLVKDNGIEVSNRSIAALTGEEQGYSPDEDLSALVRPIVGPGITAMRERAALYGGSVEATRVPGVGFTISAIFPTLRINASDSV